MTRRTQAEIKKAQAAVIADKENVTRQYQSGKSATQIAAQRGVDRSWLALQLDLWNVPRRGRAEAARTRRAH
ncbi:hypothetical protein [Streptomyces sp. MST-110588]|uniref:hypothetical protein n=1 Tax=Streptomyces sp. MST-110588 TaxID=2833628 RepID=UPI001F5CFFBC|nr:hypothetical protein [Streptomyces sp. MST-110588]UNO39251.1 hypothetical protein KGS77_05985 [Streptomyces sp. MST-110588]